MHSDFLPFSDCLGEMPRRRDMVVEALHRIIDNFGGIKRFQLRWLAREYQISEAELFELVAFYDRFATAYERNPLQDSHRSPRLTASSLGRIPGAFLDGALCEGPVAAADAPMLEGSVADFEPSCPSVPPVSCEAVLSELQRSRLRGKGGAGFPVAEKWRAVLDQPGPRYVVVNADEGEPGSFKDRFLLSWAAPQVLAGALAAAYVLEASTIYFFIRDEYAFLLKDLAAEAASLSPDWPGVTFEWRRGAGSYVCGEETAMLECIEGRPALPRHKPPYPSCKGLFGRPTLVQNVETLFWVNEILARGGEWHAGHGLREAKGLRFFSLSGRVARPGVCIAPNGTTLSELITLAGGMAAGHELAAFFPGGATGGILPPAFSQTSLDHGVLEPHGASLGTGSVMVLSRQDHPRSFVGEFMRFLAYESCGQCLPCRLGTETAARILAQTSNGSDKTLPGLAEVLSTACICGLGRGAGRLLESYLRHFHGDEML